MDASTSWLAPLLLLPGVALLIVSTAARYGQIYDEVHRWRDGHHRLSPDAAAHMLKRGMLFRNALIGLYVTVILLALGGVLGVLSSGYPNLSRGVIVVFCCSGIASLIFAALQLVRETFLSLELIQEHLNAADDDE